MQIDFGRIAPYLSDPLILVGFFLFVAFLFARGIIRAGLIPPLPARLGYRVLQTILLYGFVIGLALIVIGFLLKRNEMGREEQGRAVHLLLGELDANQRVARQLAQNAATLGQGAVTVAQVLREPRMRISATLFPAENYLEPQAAAPPPALADTVIERLAKSGLIEDAQERGRFGAAAASIVAFAERTRTTNQSLADPSRARYVMRRDVWESQLPILRKVARFDVEPIQVAYAALERVRNNYDVVVSRCAEYLAAVEQFFREQKVNRATVARVLAAERLAFELIVTYATALADDLARLKALTRDLAGASGGAPAASVPAGS